MLTPRAVNLFDIGLRSFRMRILKQINVFVTFIYFNDILVK